MSSKRHCEDFSTETPRKKPSRVLRIQVDSDEEVGNNEGKVFYFRVLLPNGITLELQVPGPPSEMPVEDFVILVRREYQNIGRRTDSPKPRRQINWTRKDLHFVDAFDNRITKTMDFRKFKSNKSHMLRLCDGSVEADKYEVDSSNMWDLTPDTDLLKELPEEYTFETALADLIGFACCPEYNSDPRVTILNTPVKIKQERIGFYLVAIASPQRYAKRHNHLAFLVFHYPSSYAVSFYA
uniref:Uncharacterized protein n=1 Tax=Solanum lycopersicum TaxID=4081 RepID=A0A3Q7GA24_SOLLC